MPHGEWGVGGEGGEGVGNGLYEAVRRAAWPWLQVCSAAVDRWEAGRRPALAGRLHEVRRGSSVGPRRQEDVLDHRGGREDRQVDIGS